ncbi:hypothetical protein Btru_072019 [Bulinus truncatus]|nr:hypothetical protein Btru_072019 [Bulinus truncatus]
MILTAVVVSLVTLVSTSYGAPTGSCNVNGNSFPNGENYLASPCMEYTCNNGTASLVREGCLENQACHAVDETWTTDCVTYKCSKTVQDNLSTYSTSVVSSSCKDANGVCRNPGETFPFNISGTFYNLCTCSKDANEQIQYSCASSTCTVNGNVYQDGQIFSLSSPCIKYQCSNGQASLVEEGCQDGQTCRPLNQNWTSNCDTYTCSKTVQNNLSTYSASVVSSSCKDANGVCRNPGETFPYNISGTIYNSCTCSKDANGQTQYSCSSGNNNCNVNGNVYQDGQIFSLSSPCIKYQCSNGQASLVEEGCQDGQSCRPLNQNWSNNCVTYTCSKTVQNNLSTYSTSVVSSSCNDANGVCRNPGETFPYTISGTTYNSCTCSKDASGQIQYSCSSTASNTCNVNGNVYQDGQIFSLSSPCIKYQCSNGQASLVEEGCLDGQICRPLNQNWTSNCVTYTCSKTVQNNLSTYSASEVSSSCKDANGVCRNPGETFPYNISGTIYNSCTCSKDANGQIKYSCSSGNNNCNVNGNVYQDGQIFSLSSPCIKYQCSNDEMTLINILFTCVTMAIPLWLLAAQTTEKLDYEEIKGEILNRSAIVYKTPPKVGDDKGFTDININILPMDIIEFNDVEQLATTASEKSALEYPDEVLLTDNGTVFLYKIYHLSFKCHIDFDKYPFDSQSCTMTWFVVKDKCRLVPTINLVPFVEDLFTVSGEWTAINVSYSEAIVESIRYHRFNFTVRRRYIYYVITIIFPLVMTSLMIPLVFLIPAMTGEKLSYLVTMFTPTAIFLNFICSVMPRGLTNVPYLAICILEVLMEGCLALMASLIVVNKFEAEEKFMTLKLSVSIDWSHQQLSWNASEHKGFDSIYLDTDLLWTPDIQLFMSVSETSNLEYPDTVMLNACGTLSFYKISQVSFRCRIDFDRYPFDSQTCSMTLFVKSENVHMIPSVSLEPFVEDSFSIGGEWRFLNVSYSESSSQYIVFHRFNFALRRRCIFYIITIIFPLVMTSLMIPLVFLIPAMTGEKLSYLVTMFTSTAIFLNFICSVMPRGLTNVPYLAIFILEVLIEGCLALIASLLVINRFKAEEKNVCLLDAKRTKNLAYEELKKDILNRSVIEYKIPPYLDGNSSYSDIFMEVFPVDIIHFNDVEQFMTVKLLIGTAWNYPELSWNSSKYEDIHSLVLETGLLWTPEIHIGLTVTECSVLDFPDFLTLKENGDVISFKAYHLSFRSHVDFEKYPFDTQRCMATMFVLTEGLGITPLAAILPLAPVIYNLGTDWTFINVTHEQVDKLHRFFFYVRRQPTYYVITIIFPLVMTSLMIPLVFLIPAMTGEKLSYLVTMFTSTAIFLNFICSVMPRGLTNVPYMAIFILEVLIEGCLAVVATLIVVNRFEAEEKKRKCPEKLAQRRLGSTKITPAENVVESPVNVQESVNLSHRTRQRTPFEWTPSSKRLDKALLIIFFVFQIVFLSVLFCGVGWI